jgi:polyisoprenoid-binding protein YceI
MRRLFAPLCVFVALVALPTVAAAAPVPFDVMANTSLVKFESEAPVENITGISTEASGKLLVDRAAPTATTGTISIPVASLRTGNTTRDGHLQSADWLDAGKHPNITFAITSVRLDGEGALVNGASGRKGTVTGTLTIKGTAKTVSAPIEVSYLAASEKLKKAYIKGDVVRVKARFDVTLADYGVKAPDHIAGVKVADTVAISVAITAASGE